MRRAVWRCFLGASRSPRSISSIAALVCLQPRRNPLGHLALRRNRRLQRLAHRATVNVMLIGQRPNRHPVHPMIATNRRELLHLRLHPPSASTFVISDPGHPDANHAGVGPNQAVITVAACRKGGAKSDRHNNTPPPHRWGHFSRPPGASSDCHGHPCAFASVQFFVHIAEASLSTCVRAVDVRLSGQPLVQNTDYMRCRQVFSRSGPGTPGMP